MTDKNLSALLEIEGNLVAQLSKEPIFIQLESIRNTIKTFQNGHAPAVVIEGATKVSKTNLPYDAENFTWGEKIQWAVGYMGEAAPAEIVNVLIPLEPAHTKVWLEKRVGVMVSQLKKKGKLGVAKRGKKSKYFIK